MVFQIARHAFCLCNVPALGTLVAAAQQDINRSTLAHEIDALSRSTMDAHFQNTVAHGRTITKIAQRGFRQPVKDKGLALMVRQRLQPSGKYG